MNNSHYPLIVTVLGLVLACAAATVRADDSSQGERSWTVHGYYKNFFTALQQPEITGLAASQDQPAQALVLNSLRLKFDFPLSSQVTLAAAYELTPQAGSTASLSQFWAQPTSSSYRLADLDQRLYPAPGKAADNLTVNQNLDRMLLTWSPAFGDILIGRQPLAFGSAHVINPTDVLAPFTFQSLDKEERVGVDAVQVRLPTSAMGEFNAGWVAGKDGRWQDSAAFVKPRFYWWDTDVIVLLMAFQEQVMAGLDLARSIGGAGTWLEAAYTFANALGQRTPEEDYWRLSVGADYNFTSTWYGYVEYHYNSPGSLKPADYPNLATHVAYTKGADFLLGRHYLCPGFTWQLSPLLSGAMQVLANLEDGSVFLSPTLDYSFADNVTWEAGAFLSFGSKAQLVTSTGLPHLEPTSEFGLYPTLLFMAAKLYF